MRVKTADLTDIALNWAVAKCKGIPVAIDVHAKALWRDRGPQELWGDQVQFLDWAEGGPIIDLKRINLTTIHDGPQPGWKAYLDSGVPDDCEYGPTPLVAALRCYVASEMGDEVNIPDVLMPYAHSYRDRTVDRPRG